MYQGDTAEEFYLAGTISVCEGIPQALLLLANIWHWHSAPNTAALELFRKIVEVFKPILD